MSKAFDEVDRTKLLGRLHQYGITGKLHDWFCSYLQGRKQQVTVLGATSRELLDDLPNTVKTSRVACYADDTNIFKSIDSITDCNVLQSDLNDLVRVGPNHLGSYLISPSVNSSVSPEKNHPYSPPILSTKRLWKLAIQRKTLVCGCQTILPRTNKWLNIVPKPTNSSVLCAELLGTSKAPKRVVHFIFLSLVRCDLSYATQVLSPQSIGLLKRDENVQRHAPKLILKLPFRCDVTYETRLQLTNLLPISYWHEFLDIDIFYKAVNN